MEMMLQALADRIDIQELTARYNCAADGTDPEALLAVFTEEQVWVRLLQATCSSQMGEGTFRRGLGLGQFRLSIRLRDEVIFMSFPTLCRHSTQPTTSEHRATL